MRRARLFWTRATSMTWLDTVMRADVPLLPANLDTWPFNTVAHMSLPLTAMPAGLQNRAPLAAADVLEMSLRFLGNRAAVTGPLYNLRTDRSLPFVTPRCAWMPARPWLLAHFPTLCHIVLSVRQTNNRRLPACTGRWWSVDERALLASA
jgi:hypothetical protein